MLIVGDLGFGVVTDFAKTLSERSSSTRASPSRT